ncbi:hypothetical protein TNCV_4004841 [Trichonephila clavipes]|nr:hypothetical protein TNCV_4004841 [Trichonephila clavipes]
MSTGVSDRSLKRNGKAWDDLLLHHIDGKRSEQKNIASKRCSSPFLIVKVSLQEIYTRRNDDEYFELAGKKVQMGLAAHVG